MKAKTTTNKLLKVRREGGSLVLAVGSFLPPEWGYIRVIKSKLVRPEMIQITIQKVD